MLDQTGLEIAQSGKPGFGVLGPRDCWGRQTAGNQGLTQINAIGLLRVIAAFGRTAGASNDLAILLETAAMPKRSECGRRMWSQWLSQVSRLAGLAATVGLWRCHFRPPHTKCPYCAQLFLGTPSGNCFPKLLINWLEWWTHKGSNLGPLPCDGNVAEGRRR
jgi:hypothetical protein